MHGAGCVVEILVERNASCGNWRNGRLHQYARYRKIPRNLL